jgi:hypothetical protein
MSSIFDTNARADESVMGGNSATRAVGLPTAMGLPGTLAPGGSNATAQALLAQSERDLADMQQPRVGIPTQREPILGYNPESGEVFSGGKTFKLDLNEGAQNAALFDVDNQQLPPGFRAARSSDLKRKLAEEYDSLGFFDATQRRAGQAFSGYGSTLQDLGAESLGKYMQESGDALAARNPSKITEAKDLLSSPGQAVIETLGEVGGYDVPVAIAQGGVGAVVGAGVGTLLAPVTGGASIPIGAFLGGATFRYLGALFETYGSVRSEQREQGIDDRGRALTAAGGSAALEALLGPEARIAGQMFKNVGREAVENTAQKGTLSAADALVERGRSGKLVRDFLQQGAVESATEVPQSGLERYGAYKELTGDEAENEYILGAAKGFIGGSMLSPIASTMEFQEAKNFIENLKLDMQTAADPRAPSPVRIQAAKRAQAVLRGSSDDPQFDVVLQEFRQKLQFIDAKIEAEAKKKALGEGQAVDLLDTAATDTTTTSTTTPKVTPKSTTPTTDPIDAELSEKFGVKPNKNSRALAAAITAAGFQLDDPQIEPIMNFAGQSYLTKGGLGKALEMLKAIPPKQGPTDVSTIDAPDAGVVATAEAPAVDVVADGTDTQVDVPPVAVDTGTTDTQAVTVGSVIDPAAVVGGEQPPGERVVQRRRKVVVNPATAPAAYVAPEDDGTTVAPQRELNEEDRQLIEQEMGYSTPSKIDPAAQDTFTGGATESSTLVDSGKIDTKAEGGTDADQMVRKLVEARFAKSKNKERDTAIFLAYLTNKRKGSYGAKGDTDEEVAKQFKTGVKNVRKIGNIEELVRVGAAMGYTDAEIRALFDAPDTSRSGPKKEAPASEAPAQAPVDESDTISSTLRASGIDDEGFGDDKSNTWKQGSKVGGDIDNMTDEAKANAVANILDKQEEIRALIESYEQQGLADAAQAERDRIQQLDDELVDVLSDYEAYLEGKRDKTKSADAKVTKKAKGKPADTTVDEDADTDVEARDDSEADFYGDDTDDLVGRNQFGKDKTVRKRTTYTAAALLAEIKAFIRLDVIGRKLRIVQSVDDLLNDPDPDVRAVGAAIKKEGAYGVAANGVAFLVADRIQVGQGRAKFMHEVGTHLGIESLLAGKDYDALTQQIVNWAKKDDGSLESEIAKAAAGRVMDADTPQEDRRAELLAYFIEEAMQRGVDPTASKSLTGPIGTWFRKLMASFESALRKLGFKPETLTAADVVDLAYGAARLELDDVEIDDGASGMKFGKNPTLPTAPSTGTVAKNIAKLPAGARGPVRTMLESVSRMGRKSMDYVVFTNDLIKRASNAGMKSAKEFGDLLAARAAKARNMELEVQRVADLYALVPEKDRGTGPDSVNAFIFESTRTGKWGYDSGKRKADPEMKKRYDALSPEAQDLVQAIFDYGDMTLELKKQTVLGTTASEFDALIAAYKAAGDTKTVAKMTKEKANTLKRFSTLFALREGIPYAPIKRTGTHVVAGKSQAYLDALEAGDTKLAAKLETNGDDYFVSFVDSAEEASRVQQRLEARGTFAKIEKFERQTDVAGVSGDALLKALVKLRAEADDRASSGDQKAASLRTLISQMYLEELADNSARKSEMRRRGISGDVDMLQSFTLQGRADANFLASLEFNPQVQEVRQRMRKERDDGGNRERASELFNELEKRYQDSLETPNRPWLDKLTKMSSIYFLLTSPAYYLQNLTQPWMMSVPAMSRRHDYTKVSTAMAKAYGDLGDVMRSVKLGNQLSQQWDFSKVPADVRSAITTLADRGQIDVGLDTELGEFRIEGQGAFTDRWNKVDKAMRIMVQKGEAINRLATAMAAYRLEMSKSNDKEAALDYAAQILQDTHGDYSRFNAPRLFNTSFGKVALQFRKFQLIQLTWYAKMIKDTFTGKDRAMAAKALGVALGHTGLLAGAVGMPGYAAISWMLNELLGDDDELWDLTDELRKLIGNEEVANVILRGAPVLADVDISGKVGAGNMLSIMPFSNADLSTSAGVMEAVGTVFTGAAGGMMLRGLDGIQLALGGDYYKGMERMLPKGLSDAMKAARIQNEGLTRRNGDVILPPEEVNAWETLVQSMGIMPADQSIVYEKRELFQNVNDKFTERAASIKSKFVRASNERDQEGMRKARQDWMQLQQARAERGLPRKSIGELMRAKQEQVRRETNTKEGVQFKQQDRGFAEEITER